MCSAHWVAAHMVLGWSFVLCAAATFIIQSASSTLTVVTVANKVVFYRGYWVCFTQRGWGEGQRGQTSRNLNFNRLLNRGGDAHSTEWPVLNIKVERWDSVDLTVV